MGRIKERPPIIEGLNHKGSAALGERTIHAEMNPSTPIVAKLLACFKRLSPQGTIRELVYNGIIPRIPKARVYLIPKAFSSKSLVPFGRALGYQVLGSIFIPSLLISNLLTLKISIPHNSAAVKEPV